MSISMQEYDELATYPEAGILCLLANKLLVDEDFAIKQHVTLGGDAAAGEIESVLDSCDKDVLATTMRPARPKAGNLLITLDYDAS